MDELESQKWDCKSHVVCSKYRLAHIPGRPFDVPTGINSTARIRARPGLVPRSSFDEGIVCTLADLRTTAGSRSVF